MVKIKFFTLASSAALLLSMTFVQSAKAVIIDFESLEQNNDTVNDIGFTYSEDGYKLDNLSSPFPFAVFGTEESRYPGSTALFNNTAQGITQLLTQSNGGLFNFSSIDLTSLNGDYSVLVSFVGTKSDSTQVFQTFTTDAILSTLETFNFSSDFTNLVSVAWTQDPNFHQFDNITVNAVPEPFTLLGAGTAIGLGSLFKKQQSKKNNKT